MNNILHKKVHNQTEKNICLLPMNFVNFANIHTFTAGFKTNSNKGGIFMN